MKKQLLILLLIFALTGNALSQEFIHPGGLHTREDLDRMKTKVTEGAHPWIDGWNKLVQDPLAQNTFRASPRANMNLRQVMSRDAHAAYLNAIRWYISGDDSHADCAIRIFNDYANTLNQVPSGGNTDIVGLGGIGIAELAMAGEIMRISDRWTESDFNRFKDMMVNYLYPVAHDFLTNHNGRCIDYYWTNWDANNIGALVAIGVLCDNREIFDEGIEYYKNGAGTGSIRHAVPHVHPGEQPYGLGQWQEAGRDQTHGFLGVGLMATVCQIAWNQGMDLYGYDNNRLLAGAEYVAQYNLWKDVPFSFYNNCQPANNKWPSINGRGWFHDRPVYELIYNHYIVRQGLEAPNTQLMAEIMRPEGGSKDHFGYGTLTFTLEPSNATVHPVPPAPASITATPGVWRVDLEWEPPAGHAVRGYHVQRSTSATGPYETIAEWDGRTTAKYTDWDAINGTTYYYRVAGINQAGTGEYSAVSDAATPQETGELPLGWVSGIVGNGTTASAAYADVNEGTYKLTGSGTDLGGTADNFGYLYSKVNGDVTITTRISQGDGALKKGLMIRESLAEDARTVAMTLGDGGGRFARMGFRNEEGASMSYHFGNTYTWYPAWFRIKRVGDTFTAYESSDGIEWFTVGTETVSMDSQVYVGYAVCTGSPTNTATITFDNVSVVSEETTLPEAPANLTATESNTQVPLSWDPVPDASGYNLKRATTSGGPYTTVATGLTGTSYTDTGLENGTTYYYVVTAANFAGESQNSTEVSITPVLALPPVPEGVVAASVSATQINLSWEASLSAESYNIKRSETGGGPYTTIATPDTTSFSDTTVDHTSTWYYVISAINELGESEDSEEVSATPGRVGYWNFDETGGSIAGDSWSVNDGTLHSGASRAPGIVNNGVQLDGSSNGYVSLPSGIMSGVNGDFTITTWVRLDEVATWARIFDFGTENDNSMFLTPETSTPGEGIRFAIKTRSGYPTVSYNYTWPLNTWTHIAVTLSGDTATMYLNGEPVASSTGFTKRPSDLGNTTNNYMGKGQNNDPYLKGSIDEFKIYNRALSTPEIAEMTLAHLPPAAPKDLQTVAGNNQVLLSWAASPGGIRYNVKRAADPEGPFERIANVDETSYIDTTAVNCEDYFYTVAAINDIGEGGDSSPSGPSLDNKLSGVLTGTSGSGGNNPATTMEAAVDGNLATYFDASVNTAWVGYDLGENGNRIITRVRYAPRAGFSHRMNGAQIQGANTPDFSDAEILFVIPKPAEWVMTEQTLSNNGGYRYIRYFSPNGYGSIAELEFYGRPARLPEFSSDSIAEGTYGSEFHYPTVASHLPKEFMAVGLPEGLSIDACTGIISGIPNAAGTFPVAVTATNYYGSATDTVEVVIKKDQTISFGSISAKHIGDADFELTAVASSGLPVTYSSSDTTVATIVDGNKLHINAMGASVITASQAGDSIYYPAAAVSQSFTALPLNISVLHKSGEKNVSNNVIMPYLQIVNGDSLGIAYDQLTMRYWLTAENYAGINTWIDYAQSGRDKVKMNYVSLPEPYEGACGYIEYGFDAALGDLLPGAGSGPIQSRLSNTDWSDFDETDDYSFQPGTSYVENEQITLYRNGQLVWGTEPLPVTRELNVKVYAKNMNSNTGTNEIHTVLKLNNEGNVPIDYKDLGIRYWFTKDSEAGLKYRIDHAELDGANISGEFVTFDPAVPGADTYFEISIDSAAGIFYPLSDTGDIEYHISKSDWSGFEESEDYSYVPKAPFAENDHITVYYQGELVYGTEPVELRSVTPGDLQAEKSDDNPYGTGSMNLDVYPNPASDRLTISLTAPLENASLYIHNSLGRLIRTEKMSGQEHVLDLGAVPQGVYILTLTSLRTSVVRKIVKK
ncbi:T9SS C-terminal target domain-containing protein [Sinomicrobium pectinilyticum]|uniref:T9SS C-terminal target domain-containing protein n=1 Tax=Sinomicrobium pectinilyticum TaxID=1084421 RepID=A0A3N0E3F6_SINP1|nr:cellulose binding domain-containing protein [Sinomicrobium pectinilyticum]RNL82374.1 T9SS C-terminal target domain-containing protein [Sinomicrobium pectinilyticum]